MMRGSFSHSRAHLEGLASAAAAFTLTYVEAEVVIAVTTEWILRRGYDNRLEVCPGSPNGSKPRHPQTHLPPVESHFRLSAPSIYLWS